ncbi:MAG TPA: ATP-binding protein [Acidilobales archaeon]|nr:ATP-binding protein [Acidilobales archaeon]
MDLGLKCTLIAVAQLIIILYLASNIQAFIIANIYVIWAFISLSLIVASIILESPIAALTETFSAILSLLIVKKVLSICLMFTPEYKLAMLMMNIDNIVGNPVTYAITFSAFIASYYSWSLILKRGDIVIDRIKDLKVSIKGFQKILLAKSFIIIAIASLITLVKPMGFYEEIVYILGVIFSLSLLVLKGHKISRNLYAIASWISLPYAMFKGVAAESIVEEEKAIEGVKIGRVVSRLVYGKPANVWLKEKLHIPKSPSWYWRVESGTYTYNPYSQINYHILIAGSSGTGKSSLAKKLIKELYYQWAIPCLVIDPHNEYVKVIEELDGIVVDASKISINPLELDECSPRERIVQVADTIQRVFRLGNLQRAVLEDLLEEAYAEKGIVNDDPETWKFKPPTFLTLLRVIEKRIEYARSSGERSRYEGLKPYIRLLSTSIFRETTISFSDILSKPSVIAMANLPGDHVKAILSETLLRKIAHYMYVSGESMGLSHYIVIDEAHRICRRSTEPSLVARLMMESRKYGIGFIIITQQPLDIDEGIIANSALKISFKLSEPENLDYMAKTLAGYISENRLEIFKEALYYMPRFYAIVRDSRLAEPAIVKIEI